MDDVNQGFEGQLRAVSGVSIVYGIILIIISMMIFANPEEAYMLVVKLLGVYLLVKGIIDFFAVFRSKTQRRGELLFASAVGIICGSLVLLQPIIATKFLAGLMTYFIGFSFIISGFVAFSESKIASILSILLGVLMLFFTKEFAIGFAWLFALLILFLGIVTLIFGASTRNAARDIEGQM